MTRRALEIVAILALFVLVRELVDRTHRALWSPFLGSWSGLLYYALWIPPLALHASLRPRPRVLAERSAWTRRNVVIVVGVVLATEWVYGLRIGAIVSGELVLRSPDSWQYLANAMIAAPLVEEWIFRGVLWDELEARSSTWLAFVVTSIVFGPWHWSSLFAPSWYGAAQTLVYWHVVFGALMGILRWRLRSIGVCIVIHGVWNALVPLSG